MRIDSESLLVELSYYIRVRFRESWKERRFIVAITYNVQRNRSDETLRLVVYDCDAHIYLKKYPENRGIFFDSDNWEQFCYNFILKSKSNRGM